MPICASLPELLFRPSFLAVLGAALCYCPQSSCCFAPNCNCVSGTAVALLLCAVLDSLLGLFPVSLRATEANMHWRFWGVHLHPNHTQSKSQPSLISLLIFGAIFLFYDQHHCHLTNPSSFITNTHRIDSVENLIFLVCRRGFQLEQSHWEFGTNGVGTSI